MIKYGLNSKLKNKAVSYHNREEKVYIMPNHKQSNIRNSSMELLRILSMIMIVSCHFATHGGFSFDMKILSIPRLWWNFIEMGGNLGVNIFVLISGYFLISSNTKHFNLPRILKFWGQVFVYSVVIYFIFCFIGVQDFGIVSCIKAVFPITFDSWWFASTYFVLYLIHPFINMLLQNLNKKTYQILIVTQLLLWCIVPTFTTSYNQSNSLVWFITLYSIAGYIKLFGLNPRFTTKSYIGFFISFSVLRYLSCIVLMTLGTKIPLAADHSLFFYNQQSILTFLSALSLFMIFEKSDIGHIKWINIIASATFGVYLIHDNSIIRNLLWHDIFKNAQYQDSIILIPYSIIVVAIVYVICTLIDLLRQLIIERPFMLLVNSYGKKIVKPFEKILSIVKSILFGKEN